MALPDFNAELADWSRRFRSGEMSVDDVQDAFASLTPERTSGLQPDLRSAVIRARQELDAIRFGMCQSGQAGEIARIFRELGSLLPH